MSELTDESLSEIRAHDPLSGLEGRMSEGRRNDG